MSSESARIAVRDWPLAICLVVVGLVVQLPALFWGGVPSKAVINALRILDGDVPYRDFWTMYAPGHAYLVAGLFKVFGIHVWVQGIAVQALIAVDAALLFTITRRLGLERRLALIVGAAFVGILWGHTEVSAYETVLVFLLAAVDRIICYLQGRGAGQLVMAGVCMGVGAWFKHDVSFYVAFGSTVGLAIAWVMLAGRRPTLWVSPAGVLLRIGGGAVAAALPMAAFLAWTAGADAWRDLVVFPATDFRVVRGERYPPLVPNWEIISAWASRPLDLEQIAQVARHLSRWIQANVPQVVLLAGFVVLAGKRRALAPSVLAVTALSLATMPLFWASAHVQQNTNFSSLWIFSVLLGTLVWTAGGTRPIVRIAVASLFVVELGAFLVRPARQVAEAVHFWPSHRKLEFPGASGIRIPGWRYEIYQPIVSFIREHVPESEPIYAGLGRHDAVVINDQTFYILSGRRVASRYNELHPGIVDREEVQREIIADLERSNVRCVVLWHFGWAKSVMDDMLADRRRQIPEIGSTLLDEYFDREFQEVARYGEYVLVWRKGGFIPPPPQS